MSIPADFSNVRPLIGIVGELFCRNNTFVNSDLIRRVEDLGGECWLGSFTDNVWYENFVEKKKLDYAGKKYSFAKVIAVLKQFMQRKAEKTIFGVFKDEFRGYEEPLSIHDTLDYVKEYFPPHSLIGGCIQKKWINRCICQKYHKNGIIA